MGADEAAEHASGDGFVVFGDLYFWEVEVGVGADGAGAYPGGVVGDEAGVDVLEDALGVVESAWVVGGELPHDELVVLGVGVPDGFFDHVWVGEGVCLEVEDFFVVALGSFADDGELFEVVAAGCGDVSAVSSDAGGEHADHAHEHHHGHHEHHGAAHCHASACGEHEGEHAYHHDDHDEGHDDLEDVCFVFGDAFGFGYVEGLHGADGVGFVWYGWWCLEGLFHAQREGWGCLCLFIVVVWGVVCVVVAGSYL